MFKTLRHGPNVIYTTMKVGRTSVDHVHNSFRVRGPAVAGQMYNVY